MIRAKFKVNSILQKVEGCEIEMFPVITGSEENKSFFKYTPAGQLKMSVVNIEVAEQFKPGDEFYIDFTKC